MRPTFIHICPIIIAGLIAIHPTETHAVSAEAYVATDSAATPSLPGVILSEVSVTAIKGGDHPNADEAVTYIGPKAVETYSLVNLKQVAAMAPNFYMPAYGSRMTSSIYVRGLGTRIDQPAVGLNIDNIPIYNKDNYDFDLADIDRIEVMRGPQNILYGRNTMGGLMNIYTVSPLSYEGLKARVSYGTQNSSKVSVGLYHKFTPKLGMALIGELSSTDGFYHNEYNGAETGRERSGSIRWKTAFRPASNVIVENSAMLSRATQNGYPYQNLKEGRIAYNDTCYYKRLSFIDGLTVKHSFRGITFSSILSFQYLDDDMVLDQDFTTANYFTLQQKRKEWALTGDFVARGPETGKYKWLVGAFGFYRRSEMNAPVVFYQTGIDQLIVANRNNSNPDYPISWDSSSFPLGSTFTMPSGGASIYHESSLKLGDFRATLGLRFDWEQTNLNYRSFCNSSYTIYDNTDPANPMKFYSQHAVDIDDNGHISKDYTQLLPKFSLTYNIPETNSNLYASVTKGYKSGGYNTQMFSDFLQQRVMAEMGLLQQYDVEQTVSYRPETDWNYEIGGHFQLFDRKFGIDFAAFWINVNDQQVTMFPEGSITGRIMTNAGKARSRGVELSVSYNHPAGWFLRGSYGFTDARFIEFNNGRADYSGNRVPFAPANTMFVGAGYSRKLSSYIDGISCELNTKGVGDIQWDEANSVRQPFYALLNASIAATHKGCRLELWANNITGTQYATYYFVSIGNAFLQRGNKFSAGFTLNYQLEFQ